ncbi:hypothetical protein TrRE_jg2217 [Triparma retinervis]|uniref:heme oxygenase (biliverdin-producing) n=1 Tax=Triparma retinervis TaxID=2557542 RepID=A0A9W6ZRL5_9STRA|nr:hypothetical protein TrRE_jg2217 [Triparma retinervis]
MQIPDNFDDATATAADPTFKCSDSDKLKLYGYFKVASTSSLTPTSSRPGAFSMVARAKWDAWKTAGKSITGGSDAPVGAAKLMYLNIVRVALGGDEVERPSFNFSDHASMLSQESVSKCPAFREGCPFKTTLTVAEMKKLMSSIPENHVASSGYISDSFKNMLASIHEMEKKSAPEFSISSALSQNERNEMSKTSCPFKNVVTTSGKTFSELLDLHTFDMSALGEDSNSVPLSENLKDGTKKSHREAENVSFVKNFIKGRVSRENYAILTGNLYHVYKTMEECMAKHGKAVLGEMFLPEKLNRTDRLLADWRYLTLQSEDSEIFPEPTPATRDYVKRIQEVSDNEPKSLVAHAYTRYMGDLSGGQILARCARRALNLPETGEGGQFYEFPAIKEGGKVFKNEYRRMLDRLRTTTEEQDMIVGEANVAFVLNMRIFEELDVLSKVPNASVRPLADALSWRTSWKEPGAEGGEKPSKDAAHDDGARCPWPFIFFHDPGQGMKDWQTWAVIGMAAAFIYNRHASAV